MIPTEHKAFVMDKYQRGKYRIRTIEGRKNNPVWPTIKNKREKPTMTNLTKSKISAAMEKLDLIKHSKSFTSQK